ncbi:MAG TPA: DNA replication and repair protein RecF [Terrimicrobiaceae bacterium]
MLRDLRLRDFRCFEQLFFEPSPGLNLILGPNAQGKSSLLEAACILLRLQSPRSNSLLDAVRFGTPGFGLDGHWNERHMQVKLSASLKTFALDSKPQSHSCDYFAIALVCWISNDDMQLVRGPGASRRRYLDFLGAQVVPNYLRHLRAYERALRSRNALLKENRPNKEILAFDQPLLDAGEALLSMRAQLCLDLGPRVSQALRVISAGGEKLEISYQPGCSQTFAEALEASRQEEMRLRMTVVGPHRDEIAISLNGQNAASFASEGQQRSIALAMKLGQAGKLQAASDKPPLFLIDDIFGELDPVRRNSLLAALPMSAQKLVTATTFHWLASAEGAATFLLSGGQITRKS